MNIHEFSDQYDILLSSYLRNKKFDSQEILDSIEINEYEKSLYLTRAQNDIVVELYSGRNAYGNAYEQTEELRRYLSSLNTTETISTFIKDTTVGLEDESNKAVLSEVPMYITQERCKVTKTSPCYTKATVECIPIKRDEYNIIKDNPFKNNKVWRVDISEDTVELISKHRISEYRVNYLKYPTPIIVEDISPLTIKNISIPTECILPEILHETILQRAVDYTISDIAKFTAQKDN